ncbi:MAG TPA: aminotransferase class I/II-fold pyridoxal phosphate-dependent enzyme, partial [Anaerolineae bacterium]|nr:aminotransferase class I/II-fold pyridoxal phosphate-dependent enzyme [Anaerolineae bacterium]
GLRFLTQAVHGGEEKRKAHESLTNPIVQTATYTFANTATLIEYIEERLTWGEAGRDEYGRYGNPTVCVAERKLAALEGGEDALLVSSGMTAIGITLLVLLSSGDHLVITDDCYRRTRDLTTQFLKRFDIDVTTVPTNDYEALEAAITPNTRLIFSETPTNPFLHVLDLSRVAEIARRHDVMTVMDTTFATPYNLRPLEYGIDLVIHSVTKYLGGHNDLLAGVVIGNKRTISRLREGRGLLGCIVDPHAAYLIIRGLKTLGLRMERHNANGMAVARWLERHPKVRRVYYPGLPSHPDHEIAWAQMRGFGGVVSFELDADGETTSQFIDYLRIPYISPSLGGVESLIEQPAIISYYEMEPEARQELGIVDELVRFAIGIEDTTDIIADLEQAL